MNIYKLKELEEDINVYADLNGFNADERAIILSIVTPKHEDYIYSILQKLAKECSVGEKAQFTNDQSPSHYKTKYEPIDFITKWGLSFSEGSIVKYITRYKQKNGAIDLNKIYFYFLEMKYGEHSKIKDIF